MDVSESSTDPPREKLCRLWNAVQGIVSDRTDDDSQSREDHETRIRRHYDQLLSNLNVPEVMTQMFTRGKLTAKEHEHLRQFHLTPIRASEELLKIVIFSSRDVYECFLESLKNTKQHHVYQMLSCDGETACVGEQTMCQHSRLIRQNYDWLTEELNPDSGLLTSLIAKEVLSQREYGQVVFEKDPFVKNEILLCIISRKSVDDFKKFLDALSDTSQGHIGKRLIETPLGDANENVTTTVIKTVATRCSDSLERRVPPKLPPKPKQQMVLMSSSPPTKQMMLMCSSPPTKQMMLMSSSPPTKPLLMKPKPFLKPTIHLSQPHRTETPSKHKKSVEYFESKLKELPNELQTEISTKLFLISRKSSKDNIWKTSFTQILQESRNIKRQNIIQAKAANENCERLMKQSIQFERENRIIREDLQLEKTKAKTQQRELQEKINDLEYRLNLTEKENRNLSVDLKKREVEVQSLKVLLNQRQMQQENENVKIIEELKDDVKSFEMKLSEAEEELREAKKKLTEKDQVLMATTTKLDETREKLKENEDKLKEFEAKTDTDNSNPVGLDLEVTLLDLRHEYDEERKRWVEEKKRFVKEAQELHHELSGYREKYLDLEQKLELERSRHHRPKKETHEQQTQKRERLISTDELESKYRSNPVLVHTIRTKTGKKKKLPIAKSSPEERKSIRGLTILDKQLFVVSERSSVVDVYDSTDLSHSGRWDLKELIRPMDIGSCKKNKCIYIFDCKGSLLTNEILKVHPSGKLIKSWSAGVELGYGLSVTGESNIILTDYNKNKLNEYSSDGQLIREMNLSHADIHWPWHAIKLPNGHFVVSHGSIVDDLHRVCIVDSDGKLKKSFGGQCGSTVGQMNRPVYLFVDGNGFVMVADQLNGRVMLLDSNLEYKREILSKGAKHGLHDPWNIILDETNHRLFVADNESDNQRILIFDFK